MEEKGYFEGEDRLEFVEELGRPIRMGSPENLIESDFDNVVRFIESKNWEEAKKRLELLHGLYSGMNSTFLEWAIALPHEFFKKAKDEELVNEISRKAYDIWLEGVSSHSEFKGKEALEVTKGILNPDKIGINSILKFREISEENESVLFLRRPNELYGSLLESVEGEDITGSVDFFSQYFDSMRTRHDLCGEYVTSYGSQVLTEYDQKTSIDIMQEGLESSPLVSGIWDLIKDITPELSALLMAEHLRGHFSGEGRKGSVRVVVDDEKYSLVFEPCGTGGAIRQRNLVGTKNLPNASPDSWGLENKVCTYCAHCSRNEQSSKKNLGWIAWGTEFNDDPNICGWTFYKEPDKMPQKFFDRLGIKKVT